jgi:3-deoxy-7-phosphoheptulonate synthase
VHLKSERNCHALIEAVFASDAKPLWVTDPMHGNGITTKNGYKSRHFDDVMDEVSGFFDVHKSLGSFPGGLHIELTGDDVAECLGDPRKSMRLLWSSTTNPFAIQGLITCSRSS